MKLFLRLIFFLISANAVGQSLETDRLALIDLYNATDGPLWVNRNSWQIPGYVGENPCGWFGVTCENGRVTELELPNNNLVGNIPNSIGDLTSLKVLQLNKNKLSGLLPYTINHMYQLVYLFVNDNQLSGYFPNLSEIPLTYNVNVENNRFTFEGMESTVHKLDLYAPQAKIPLSYNGGVFTVNAGGSMSNNTYNWYRNGALIVSNTNVNSYSTSAVGTYRVEVTNRIATQLTLVSENHIIGPVGPVYNLETDRLALISLYNSTNGGQWNRKSGWSVPGNVGDNPCGWEGVSCTDNRVTMLDLHNNNLVGTISASVGDLSQLTVLSIDRNTLSGSVPNILSGLMNLVSLNLNDNNLSGTIPTMSNIPVSGSFRIENNRFTFDGMESNISKLDTYSPQAKIVLRDSAGILTAFGGGTIANNSYVWYRNAELAAITSTPSYKATGDATYHVVVANSIVTGLVLQSENYFVAGTNSLENDRLALKQLYTLTNGNNWINKQGWVVPGNTGDNPCGWYGVTCAEGRVVTLNLSNNNLEGRIGSLIGNLNQLTVLALDKNKLSFDIPAGLSNLSRLTVLALNDNQLTGLIPSLASISSSCLISVENNRFNFYSLESNMDKLDSYAPQGKIEFNYGASRMTVHPEGTTTGATYTFKWFQDDLLIATTTNVNNYYVGDNAVFRVEVTSSLVPGLTLTSSDLVVGIPTSLERDRLALVALYNSTSGNTWNNRQGWTVPGNPGDSPCGWYGVTCSSDRVTAINLQNNNLVGTIPAYLSKINFLQTLVLSNNQLDGGIPSELSYLLELRNISLNNNKLSGSIPVQLSKLQYLNTFKLEANQLSGIIPFQFGNLSQLTDLNLSSNNFVGNIPEEFGNLAILTSLILNNNQLTGTIPVAVGNLNKLKTLRLSYNQFTGSIPSELKNLTLLNDLYLDHNQLSGNIPDMSDFRELTWITIGDNRFNFQGIESNVSKLDIYFPQAELVLTTNNGILSVSAGGQISNNTVSGLPTTSLLTVEYC